MKAVLVSLVVAAVGPFAYGGSADQRHEQLIEAPGPLAALRGTALIPEAPIRAVILIVPGSGPTDRDGNNALGVRASTYKLLAEGLVNHGIATVRIDKRGLLGSADAVADGNAVTVADYVDDVRSWVGVLRRQFDVPCVWVLGHSEGGLVALSTDPGDPKICGLILVATPGRRLGRILREQLKANPANAPVLQEAFATLDTLESGKRVETSSLQPALKMMFAPGIQGFLMSVLALEPTRLIAKFQKPTLIIQGERDLQVGALDAQVMAAAAPAAQLQLFSDVNHVLKRVDDDTRAANLASYGDPTLPLAGGIVEAITRFIAGSPSSAICTTFGKTP